MKLEPVGRRRDPASRERVLEQAVGSAGRVNGRLGRGTDPYAQSLAQGEELREQATRAFLAGFRPALEIRVCGLNELTKAFLDRSGDARA
jgi:hypothetical protein